MQKYNKDAQILEKVIFYCETIENTIIRFGDKYEIFDEDFAYQNACSMCLLQIGELISRFSDDFRAKHTAIPWRSIRGMRNLLVHEYEHVNNKEFWNTLINDIPSLKSYCLEILPVIKKDIV